MLVIIGESASGKTTLANLLVESKLNYKKIITYTTRPMREGEVAGEDYHFVTQEMFDNLLNKDFFVEHANYRGWSYGTAKSDCEDENSVAILTPSGFRELKKLGFNVTSVYLYVDRRSRLIKNLKRGDDIEEAYRRSLSDVGQFDGIEKEVDYVIDNTEYHMTPDQTLLCLKAALGLL